MALTTRLNTTRTGPRRELLSCPASPAAVILPPKTRHPTLTSLVCPGLQAGRKKHLTPTRLASSRLASVRHSALPGNYARDIWYEFGEWWVLPLRAELLLLQNSEPNMFALLQQSRLTTGVRLRAGDESQHDSETRGRDALAPAALHIPKNKSTSNLAVTRDNSEKARIRFSFDAGAAAAEYDNISRLACLTVPSGRHLGFSAAAMLTRPCV